MDVATDSPQPGESFLYHAMPYTDIDGFENMVTWDYSGLSGGTTGILNILAPGSTAQGASFPNATYVEQWPSGELRFYAANGGGLWHQGLVQGGTTIAHEENAAVQRIKFPLHFTDQWTNTLVANYTVGSTPYYRYGNVYGSVPGYGTLVMPYGTIDPVIKIKYTEVIADFGPDTVQHTVTTIGLYRSGVHAPIIYSRTDVATNWNGDTLSSTQEMHWMDEVSIGMAEALPGTRNAKVFPNPASGSAWLSMDQPFTGVLDIVLLDATGRQVIRYPRAVHGGGPLELPLAQVAPGAYHVRIKDDRDAHFILPLVVE